MNHTGLCAQCSRFHLAMAAALVVICLSRPGSAADSPGSQPALVVTAGDRSTTQPSAADPQVDAILGRLEAKGVAIETIECKILYVKVDPVLEDKQEYSGTLRFKEGKPNPKFLIEFDRFKHEGQVKNRKQWHAFDGQWYIEARESTETITKREILPPGSQEQVFRLGKGLFPLPFGQKKAEILQYFEVKLIPSKPGDPPQSDHLECKPRPGTDLARRYDAVHFYIDRAMALPVRVETVDKEEGNQITAAFGEIKLNTGMVDSQLKLPNLPKFQTDTIPLANPAPDRK